MISVRHADNDYDEQEHNQQIVQLEVGGVYEAPQQDGQK